MSATRSIFRLYVKKETTPGTFEDPSGSDLIHITEATLPKPVTETEMIHAAPDTLIKNSNVHEKQQYWEVTFSTYLKKIPNNTTPPRVAPLFEAAAMEETQGTSQIKYTPTTSHSTVSVLLQYDPDGDGYEVKLKGCVVKSVSIKSEAGGTVVATFTVWGILESESGTITSITPSADDQDIIVMKNFNNTAGVDKVYDFEFKVENDLTILKDPSQSNPVASFKIVKQEATMDVRGLFETSFIPSVGDEISSFTVGNADFAITSTKAILQDKDEKTFEDEIIMQSITILFAEDYDEPYAIKFLTT